MLARICREYQKRMLETRQDVPVVTYDCDEILWKLMRRLAPEIGLKFEDVTAVFAVSENYRLTAEQKQVVLSALADTKYFRDIMFEPGTADILKVCDLGAEVVINSNAFTEEIAETKYYQLLAAIPGLKPDQIKMNIVCAGESAQRKIVDSRTTIFADDSPYNVAMSPALLSIIPRDLPWSICPRAIEVMRGKRVFCAENLVHINRLIYQTVDALRSA